MILKHCMLFRKEKKMLIFCRAALSVLCPWWLLCKPSKRGKAIIESTDLTEIQMMVQQTTFQPCLRKMTWRATMTGHTQSHTERWKTNSKHIAIITCCQLPEVMCFLFSICSSDCLSFCLSFLQCICPSHSALDIYTLVTKLYVRMSAYSSHW